MSHQQRGVLGCVLFFYFFYFFVVVKTAFLFFFVVVKTAFLVVKTGKNRVYTEGVLFPNFYGFANHLSQMLLKLMGFVRLYSVDLQIFISIFIQNCPKY